MSDSTAKNERLDRVFRALASRPRREILALLATAASDPAECCSPHDVCACRFSEELGLSASTVSHHMKALSEAGLVDSEKRGLWVYYRLRAETVAETVAEFGNLLRAAGCCRTPVPTDGCAPTERCVQAGAPADGCAPADAPADPSAAPSSSDTEKETR